MHAADKYALMKFTELPSAITEPLLLAYDRQVGSKYWLYIVPSSEPSMLAPHSCSTSLEAMYAFSMLISLPLSGEDLSSLHYSFGGKEEYFAKISFTRSSSDLEGWPVAALYSFDCRLLRPEGTF